MHTKVGTDLTADRYSILYLETLAAVFRRFEVSLYETT